MPGGFEKEVYEVDGFRGETDNAWLMLIRGEEMWLPKSQCEFDPTAMAVEIPAWLAAKKGF